MNFLKYRDLEIFRFKNGEYGICITNGQSLLGTVREKGTRVQSKLLLSGSLPSHEKM